jgi:hypothetical protein
MMATSASSDEESTPGDPSPSSGRPPGAAVRNHNSTLSIFRNRRSKNTLLSTFHLLPTSKMTTSSSTGDSSPPAVGHAISTLMNIPVRRIRNSSDTCKSLKRVVFRSHDPIIDDLLLRKMSGTHDAALIKMPDNQWQDTIMEN